MAPSKRLKRFHPVPNPPRNNRASWATAGIAIGVLTLVAVVVWWVNSLGGPHAFRSEYGLIAPLISFPTHVLATLTPIGEMVPFGIANGAAYGLLWGSVLNWMAWMTAAYLQQSIGRYAVHRIGRGRLPAWFRRLPIRHPVTLITARWVPGGGPIVDAVAGAADVPLTRIMTCAAIGHGIQALAVAGIGAGILELV
jgi:uncharacterized membrane protein YdjX (TVP38/TMEM64 family)